MLYTAVLCVVGVQLTGGVHTQVYVKLYVMALPCAWHCLCISQMPSLSPWSSKEGTVQTSSPSSVGTVTVIQPHCGYTMGQRRVVQPLVMPSLVQCTLFIIEQNTPQPLLELTMYEHWIDTSSSVHTMYWATSPRAMQSSTPSFLLVSREVLDYVRTYVLVTLLMSLRVSIICFFL